MTKRDNFATFFTAEAFLFCSVKTATERFNLSDLLFSLHCYMPLALLCTQQLLPIKIGTIIPRASMLLAEKEKKYSFTACYFSIWFGHFIIYTVDNISKCIQMETNVRKMPAKCPVYGTLFDVSKCCNELRKNNSLGMYRQKCTT